MQPQKRARVPAIAILRDGNFRTFWYVGGLVWTAYAAELFVLSWFVLQRTDDPFKVSMVLVAYISPWPLLILFAGSLADKLDRHKLLVGAQLANLAIAILILTLITTDHIQTWHVFVLAFIQGTAKAVDLPARRTSILDIVGVERLVNALSIEVTLNNAGRMLGPILTGVLLGEFGFKAAYGFIVGIHLLNLVLLAQVHVPDAPVGQRPGNLWSLVLATARYSLQSPLLLTVLYVTVVLNALGWSILQLIPVVGKNHLEVGPLLVGILVSSLSFGQLMGTASLAVFGSPRHLGRLFVGGSLVFLLSALVFSSAPWYPLALLALMAAGFGGAGFETGQASLTVLSAPRQMRGGTVGLMTTGVGVGIIVGNTEAGAVASALTAPWAIAINVIAGALLLLPLLFLSPLSRRTVLPAVEEQTETAPPGAD